MDQLIAEGAKAAELPVSTSGESVKNAPDNASDDATSQTIPVEGSITHQDSHSEPTSRSPSVLKDALAQRKSSAPYVHNKNDVDSVTDEQLEKSLDAMRASDAVSPLKGTHDISSALHPTSNISKDNNSGSTENKGLPPIHRRPVPDEPPSLKLYIPEANKQAQTAGTPQEAGRRSASKQGRGNRTRSRDSTLNRQSSQFSARSPELKTESRDSSRTRGGDRDRYLRDAYSPNERSDSYNKWGSDLYRPGGGRERSPAERPMIDRVGRTPMALSDAYRPTCSPSPLDSPLEARYHPPSDDRSPANAPLGPSNPRRSGSPYICWFWFCRGYCEREGKCSFQHRFAKYLAEVVPAGPKSRAKASNALEVIYLPTFEETRRATLANVSYGARIAEFDPKRAVTPR